MQVFHRLYGGISRSFNVKFTVENCLLSHRTSLISEKISLLQFIYYQSLWQHSETTAVTRTARKESAGHYIISADISSQNLGGFIVKSADIFITQNSGSFFRLRANVVN